MVLKLGEFVWFDYLFKLNLAIFEKCDSVINLTKLKYFYKYLNFIIILN